MLQQSVRTVSAGAEVLTVARTALAAGQAQRALALLLPVLRRRVDDPGVLDCAAMCYWQLGDADTALSLMAVLTDGWPALAAGWSKRAAMAASAGARDLADTCLRRALTLEPRSVPMLAALNRIAPFSRNSALTRRLKEGVRDRTLPPATRAMGLNALARIEARAGRHRAAFRQFAAAKAVIPGRYDVQETDARVRDQRLRYDPGRLPALPVENGPVRPRVVFVAGMPRSGTTLVESILSRHPDVASAGESTALARALAGLQGRAVGHWDWLACADVDAGKAARAGYFDGLGAAGAAGKAVVIDKMPLNILDLGFAAWILPEARFVFLDRDPLDVGLSCFTTNFHEGNGFSHDLRNIGHLTRAVHRSATDYVHRLGGRFRWQSYRALVAHPEHQTRALLAHAGLSFHPDCLSPEAGTGPVRTASLYQVREGINRKGLGKWRDYAAELVPLRRALGDDWLRTWGAADAARVSAVQDSA